ncbi:MAG: alkaline phosphatase family protein [Fimbriimonas sp.]
MVLLISIDGLRPDALLAANAPTLQRLAKAGRTCLTAQTQMPSVTLPCHTSMVRGVPVERHGITSNTFTPLARPVPSILDVASQHGRRCGAFFNWGPLRDLFEPESVVVSHFVRDAHRIEGDTRVADSFVRSVAEEPLDFAFVYFGHVDECGHQHGWMSDQYLLAVAHADACVERVLSVVGSGQWIIQSDHGGHDRSHGTTMPEDMTIPWILAGDGIEAKSLEGVTILDTAPSLAHLLGVPAPPVWEGQSHS